MHWREAEELAARMLGMDPELVDGVAIDIDEELAENFGIDLEQFQKIAEALLPFTIPARTPLMKMLCQGYVYDGAFICKQEIPEND